MTAAADQSEYRQFVLNVGHPVPSTASQRRVPTMFARQVLQAMEDHAAGQVSRPKYGSATR